MKSIHVKLCGFRRPEEVREAAALEVDRIGFILARGRRRSVEPEVFPDLVREAGPDRSVGVLVDPAMEEIGTWLDRATWKTVQLCGGESPDFCRRVKETFGLSVIKVFHVCQCGKQPAFPLDAYASSVDAFLLDAFAPEGGGGGKTFDWNLIPPVLDRCRRLGKPLWVAGGLTASNVGKLLGRIRPDGVDVSGGIERNGKKCPETMKRFLKEVRSHEDT
ncbi:phosphoribosylanthranilate isomerase [Staphylospora marina]|uniref:phosphoribosylanthranilate isomerase n=1 Tax=Staphylospora marina TaxID=2490858 RepID=UPI0013DD8729|nr:phosphoribosylanthranilate isomerase [Staphylospora marina]